jgi:hypothetical protein
MVLSIYRELVHRFPEMKTKPAVAIISPYKAQASRRVPATLPLSSLARAFAHWALGLIYLPGCR